MKLLVTGGAGFIGSTFVRQTLAARPDAEILNFDALTYAGNLENLAEVAGDPRYRFVKGNICDTDLVEATFQDFQPDAVVHFAAESHVDRSILSPKPVVDTNFTGTFVMLEAARRHATKRFLHVSTDEVYGSIDPPHEADESYPLRPSSPYSASKAGSDLLALSYYTTYKMPVVATRASNNYGPYQFPEKLIPLMISNALEDRPLPIYGDGMQERDWLHVEDHCRAIAAVLDKGRLGEVYNIGGNRALPNLDVVRMILEATGKPEILMMPVEDRPGHDRRYAITTEKVTRETGWKPRVEFERGLGETVRWYRENRAWIAHVRSGQYRQYYDQNYGRREEELRRLVK
ncbi:MAG: dTDP-glucose 4,6-dehydratase [Bryobacterales bacterium]